MAENKERKLQYHLRIRLFYEERNFGPGVVGLMTLVRERGSLSAACQEMHMAYSKAWKIIHKAEEDLGIELMEGRRGGEHGGTTVLTEKGEDFLNQYLAFAEEVDIFAEKVFHKYFPV
ncbi:MAG: LysR family transcriptional regulator [Lacrimispora sp.]|uniref:winged helix-turn-helix domain-containing protein n=1 Tax=Lacrimispora sp. TaxID=2719234 RepID=UPI0039E44033